MRDVSDTPSRSSRENAIKKTPGMQTKCAEYQWSGLEEGREVQKTPVAGNQKET